MSDNTVPYLLTNENSTAFWLIDNLWMPLATSAHTGNRFSLMEQICGTGIGGPQVHMHPADEGMYIMEGHCTYQVAGQRVEAGPGSFVSILRQTEHSFTVDAPGTRLLNWYLPGGFERIITEFATPTTTRTLPPARIEPRGSREQLRAWEARVGMTTLAVPDFLRLEIDA